MQFLQDTQGKLHHRFLEFHNLVHAKVNHIDSECKINITVHT